MAFYIIEFVITFVITYLIYYSFFIKRNYKKRIKPLELSYLQNKYNLDLKKINKTIIGIQVSIINAFIIASSIILIGLIDNFIFKLLIGFIYLITFTIFSYYLLGTYYKKIGMNKDE